MLRTSLVEDLNRLACPAAQERLAPDPARAREALNSLRFLDTTELDRYAREGWLRREELDHIERFAGIARDNLVRVPEDLDPVEFTRRHEGWQITRERALELVVALDAFVDIGVAGWGHQFSTA